MAVNSAGNLYVFGTTRFPLNYASALQPQAPGTDCFILELDPSGNEMYFTYLGGGAEASGGMFVDSTGMIYVSGSTSSAKFSMPPGTSTSPFADGVLSGFIAKVDPTANKLLYVTALGGCFPTQMTVNGSSIYLAGGTNPNISEARFNPTPDAIQSSPSGFSDGCLMIASTSGAIQYASYFGGNSTDLITGVSADSNGIVTFVGFTNSDNLPTTADAVQKKRKTTSGANSAFLVRLNSDRSLLYSSYVGGSKADDAIAVVLDSSGNAYVAGDTSSSDIVPSANAFQSKLPGSSSAFLARFDFPPPAPPSTVQITSVNTSGGSADITQNAWIEIHGSNLAPSSIGPNGMTWSSAPEFLSGRMPTQLSNVSVKVNGKPAYVYFISAGQVNVLTPLDNTTGSVQIVVSNGTSSSAPFSANLRAATPSFFLFGSSSYIAATHADGSLLGPASMSVPGYTFTPAQLNETIILYGTGFALPSVPLTDGSAMQSGSLPSLPVIKFGNSTAQVSFAGVVSPGEYQLNVVVPPDASHGDNTVTVTYNGVTPARTTLIAVQ